MRHPAPASSTPPRFALLEPRSHPVDRVKRAIGGLFDELSQLQDVLLQRHLLKVCIVVRLALRWEQNASDVRNGETTSSPACLKQTRFAFAHRHAPLSYRENLEEELAVGVPPELPQPKEQAVCLLGDSAGESQALLQDCVQELHERNDLACLELWQRRRKDADDKKGRKERDRKAARIFESRSPARSFDVASPQREALPATLHRVTLEPNRPCTQRTRIREPLLPNLLDPLFRLALGHVLVPNLQGHDAGCRSIAVERTSPTPRLAARRPCPRRLAIAPLPWSGRPLERPGTCPCPRADCSRRLHRAVRAAVRTRTRPRGGLLPPLPP